jgi:hypothetical protein
MRLLGLLALALVACGDDDSHPGTGAMDGAVPADGAAPGADAASLPPSDCAPNPKSYLEIINACTDAEKVSKQPVLPLLRADGTLPPLP